MTEIMIGKKIFAIIEDSKKGNIIECDGIGFNLNIN